MTYTFLQHYWWFVVSLLGALLVFLMFVQGANSMIRSLGWTDEGRRLVINSTGRKWEFTFTTLVTFGGAFFASFPLFYSTSFGGAYWLWMIILFTFVLQAVSYEFQNKLGNLLGPRTFQFFLVLNGLVGPLLLGGAVATFFEGSNFIVEKGNIIDAAALTPIISRWAHASHGLDALLNPWVLVFGLAVVFLARTLGTLYVMNNVADEDIRSRGSVRLVGTAVPFVLLFVVLVLFILVFFFVVLVLFSFVVFMLMFMLHALDDLLQLDVLAHGLHQVDHHHVWIHGFGQSVLDPLVALATHIGEHVAGGDLHDVLGGGLVAVQVHAVVQQHGDLDVVVVSDGLAHPVIDGEDGGHDAELFLLRKGSARENECEQHDEHSHAGYELPHDEPPNIRFVV